MKAALNQTTHNTWCRKCSSFHNSLLNIWQVASLLYNDFVLSHYSFAVRKTNYNFSVELSRKKAKKDLFLNKTFLVCIKFNHILKLFWLWKWALPISCLKKNIKVVWFWPLYQIVLGFVLGGGFTIKSYETLRIYLECLKLFSPSKSHCFVHVSFDNRSWIKKGQQTNIFLGFSQALRVRILKTEPGETCRRDKSLTPFWTRLLTEV